MPLVIHLKKDQRIIVNGAVLENASGRTVSLAVRNEAAVLRDGDVMQFDAAETPATRIYFALQCAYLFADRRSEHLAQFRDLLDSYLQAAPSASPIAEAMRTAVDADNLYDALKKARPLFEHERGLLSRG